MFRLATLLPPLAEQIALDRFGAGLRGPRGGEWNGLLLVLLGLLAVALVIWIISFVLGGPERRGVYFQPWRLFLSLCDAHRLSWRQYWLLWRIAQFYRLAEPALLFVDPQRFESSLLGPRFASYASELARLREQLFAESPPVL